MIVHAKHFDPNETQEAMRIWLQCIGAKMGDEVKIHDFIIWANRQSAAFKTSIGEPLSKHLCHIYDWQERYLAFMRAQIPKEIEINTNVPLGQLSIFDLGC